MSLHLMSQLFRQSVATFFAYRMTSLFVIVFGSLFSVIEIVTVLVYYQFTDDIAGYSLPQFLLVIASFECISNLYQFLFVSAHEQMADKIIGGELDYDFIRPVDSQLYNSLSGFDLASGINLIIPIVLLIYAVPRAGHHDWLQGVCFVLFLLIGTFMYYLMNQLFVALSFWVERPGKLLGIPEYLFDLASRPRSVYPRVLQLLFAWILPIVASTNLPVDVLRGQMGAAETIAYLTGIAVLAALVRLQWKCGIARYQSAN
ncbi:MAG: ABC-2 family transporter protein [Sporolactobacillus sp.]